jgi:HEAT repeat protein
VSQTCPTCGKPLDATRAPVARIRGARVVTYCSVACAEGGGTGLAAGSQTGAPAVVDRAAPVVERAAPVGEKKSAPAEAKPADRKPAEKPAAAAVDTAVAPAVIAPAAAREKRADEPARVAVDPVVPLRAETRPSRRGRGAFLVLLTILLGAGVAFLLIELWPLGESEPNGAAAPRAVEPAGQKLEASAGGDRQATPEAAAPAAPAAAPDRDGLYRAAVAELGALGKSNSPRIVRLAAQALARTGDPAALARLRALLGEEQSQLGRIQIAYALARAGDQAAREELRRQLAAERRDVRLDAARSLVQLGDDSGRKTLRAMLPLDNYRLGAAGLLARLKDPEGIKVLRTEMTKKTSAENVMRAVVALGRAGEVDVQDQLRTIVHDRRYNVGAADALAALGDTAAVEPLTQQLALSAMRVQAALWLRRMDQKVDLAPLQLALESGDDASRVSAAEALIVLTGPANLAERD